MKSESCLRTRKSFRTRKDFLDSAQIQVLQVPAELKCTNIDQKGWKNQQVVFNGLQNC